MTFLKKLSIGFSALLFCFATSFTTLYAASDKKVSSKPEAQELHVQQFKKGDLDIQFRYIQCVLKSLKKLIF